MQALQNQPDVKRSCETYAAQHDFRNVDHLLEHLVSESPFSALVVIDRVPENLEAVLADKFRFGVEALELARYQNAAGERIYHFEPFLEDVLGEPAGSRNSAEQVSLQAAISPDEIDTVVVPAREDGFQAVFLGQNCWYAVRIPYRFQSSREQQSKSFRF